MPEAAVYSLISCAAAAAGLIASLWIFLRVTAREKATAEQFHEIRLQVTALEAKVDALAAASAPGEPGAKPPARVPRLRALLEAPRNERTPVLAVVPARQEPAADPVSRRHERAFDLASEGQDASEIAKLTGMSPGEVRLLLKLHGTGNRTLSATQGSSQ